MKNLSTILFATMLLLGGGNLQAEEACQDPVTPEQQEMSKQLPGTVVVRVKNTSDTTVGVLISQQGLENKDLDKVLNAQFMKMKTSDSVDSSTESVGQNLMLNRGWHFYFGHRHHHRPAFIYEGFPFYYRPYYSYYRDPFWYHWYRWWY